MKRILCNFAKHIEFIFTSVSGTVEPNTDLQNSR